MSRSPQARIRHRGQIDQRPAVLHPDRKYSKTMVRIVQRLPGAEVEFPAVPRACQDGNFRIEFQLSRYRGRQTSAQNARTDRPTLMRAEIVHGIDRPIPASDADLPTIHANRCASLPSANSAAAPTSVLT